MGYPCAFFLFFPLPMPTGGPVGYSITAGSAILTSSLGLLLDGGAIGSSGNSSARDLYFPCDVLWLALMGAV
jgi:hypothetical protein